jgi:hypothetical protein
MIAIRGDDKTSTCPACWDTGEVEVHCSDNGSDFIPCICIKKGDT